MPFSYCSCIALPLSTSLLHTNYYSLFRQVCQKQSSSDASSFVVRALMCADTLFLRLFCLHTLLRYLCRQGTKNAIKYIFFLSTQNKLLSSEKLIMLLPTSCCYNKHENMMSRQEASRPTWGSPCNGLVILTPPIFLIHELI